jgi:putative flippase GtrA
MIDSLTLRQSVRYALVGLGLNGLVFVIYLMLTYQGLDFRVSMTIAYVTGVMLSFLANSNWSFEHDGALSPAFLRYMIAYFLGYILNLAILWAGVEYLLFPHQLVQAFSIAVVAVILFALQKRWVFSPQADQAAS